VSRSTVGGFRGALRWFALGSGPLKRRTDRVQALARLVLVLAFLAAPSLAVLAATKATTHLDAAAAAEAAQRYRVTAFVLADAPTHEPATGASMDPAAPVRVHARARWTTPSGDQREGTVLVPVGSPAGADVPIWIDQQGDITAPPMDPRDIPGTAMAFALLALLGLPITAWVCYVVVCAGLDARRDREWTDGWAAVEPRWKAQLP
jgi:hypothetical protein